MSNVQPLELVGRGSETQLQVGENINEINKRDSTTLQIVIAIVAKSSEL